MPRGHETDMVSGVNDGGQRGLLLVHPQHSGDRGLPAEHQPLAVQGNAQALSRLSHHIAIAVAVHQQNVPQGEHPVTKQLGALAVQGDHIAVV